MRIDLGDISRVTGKAAEACARIQASIRAAPDGDVQGMVNPIPMNEAGRCTKNFYRAQIADAGERLKGLQAATEGPGGLSAEGGMGLLIKTFQDQLVASQKALATAPEKPGLFDIYA